MVGKRIFPYQNTNFLKDTLPKLNSENLRKTSPSILARRKFHGKSFRWKLELVMSFQGRVGFHHLCCGGLKTLEVQRPLKKVWVFTKNFSFLGSEFKTSILLGCYYFSWTSWGKKTGLTIEIRTATTGHCNRWISHLTWGFREGCGKSCKVGRYKAIVTNGVTWCPYKWPKVNG